MTQQHRPLTGMVGQNGIAAPVAVLAGPPTLIHQLDASSPTNFLDEVSLFVVNNDVATQNVSVVVANGPALVLSVPANSTRAIFSEQPFFGQPGQAANSQITVQALGGVGMVAYGFFTRN